MSDRKVCEVKWCVSLVAPGSQFCAIHRNLKPVDPGDLIGGADKWRSDVLTVRRADKRREDKEARRIAEEAIKKKASLG